MRAALVLLTLAALLLPLRPACALQAQIGNLSDLSLPGWSIGDPAVSAHMDLCVYATGLNSGTYSVIVTSTGAFNLVNGLRRIPYSLTWDASGAGNLGNGSGVSLTTVALLNQGNASTSSKTCSAGMTARLNLKITQAAMTAATGGTYTDVLTILITPN